MSQLRYQPARAERGFTLTEMLITVAIIAIIASVALPSYMKQARRANRTDATVTLLQIANAQEKYYLQNRTYAPDLATLGITTTEHDFYKLTLPTATANTFKATATAQYGQLADKSCKSVSIDHNGSRTASNSTGGDATTTCW